MILHLDMDAFFASIEQIDNPDLRGQPVIVGGGERGVVATASYEARAYGVNSAMTIAQAKRLCPHAHFLRGRGSRYSQISATIMACLHNYSPAVQAASIDEAYLDISGLGGLFTSPIELARSIKDEIRAITHGLTCSIGIAPVKFLAKICSDINKPDGIFVLSEGRVEEFLTDLPVSRLPGVGKALQASLHACGVFTVGQLRQLSQEFLSERYGKIGKMLFDRARGRDQRKVHENPAPKSESAEKTFSRDVTDQRYLSDALLLHAEKVGSALRKNGLAGYTVTLKIKFSDFHQITRSKTLPRRTNVTAAIHACAVSLLNAAELVKPVRLIGLAVSGFEEKSSQISLPGLERQLETDAVRRSRKLDRVIDELRARFGHEIVHRAAISRLRSPDIRTHHFE